MNKILVIVAAFLSYSCGNKGDQGPPGPPGNPGVDGTGGNNGKDGANGRDGETGPRGSIGPTGSSAQPCTVVATSSGAAITCNGNSVAISNGTPGSIGATGPRGAVGANGTQGVQGAAGASGAQGSAGTSGADGTSVTPVKLCADSSSAFPEYGLRIGSALYAVYWGALNGDPTPQAFLAQIVPGSYESTNGSGCTFTVNADGIVRN